MKLYPASAATQLEFEKVKEFLARNCETKHAKQKTETLRIHTKKSFIETELRQAFEFKNLLQQAQYFPNDFTSDISRELKLLSIAGGMLTAEDFLKVYRLSESMQKILRWFDKERRALHPALTLVIQHTYYEKAIIESIDKILDNTGNIKDSASKDLGRIRQSLFSKRNEQRRVFEKVITRLNKAGYTAEIEENFSNGRRVVAVFSEHKRQVKGILHGESDSRKTAFIEPEETIDLNNQVFQLELDEQKEITRILRQLTAELSVYATLLQTWLEIVGEFDFIEAKAKLAITMHANLPAVNDKAIADLRDAYHPLLYLYNKSSGKTTVPLTIQLNDEKRILVISGPNAGGKTVSMKTLGLLQIMLQSGLLVPVHPDSQMGIFKQLFIHIGDTQNLEFELSTYSAHLIHMKFFIENANGKTLFFIDELGSGSDPNMGSAFAEVILEELSRRHAIGMVTTHYLNLKVMANHTAGIVNASMAFDEAHLQPLYQLTVGKPGSSYTFAIAERIGLPKHLINRAKKMVDEQQYRLDHLLNQTEQDRQSLVKEKKEVNKLLNETQKQKNVLDETLNKEKHRQQVEVLKHKNKLTEERLTELKDAERKMRQLVNEWRKSEKKEEVIKEMQKILFPKSEKSVANKLAKKIEAKYKEEQSAEVEVGAQVKMKRNHQVGRVTELRGKKAIVQIGLLPMTIDISDLVVVTEKN